MGIFENVFESHAAMLEDIATGEQVNTYHNWKLVSKSRLFVNPPEPKYNYYDVEGSDGNIDETMFPAERVLYKNRTGSWTFFLIDLPYFDLQRTFHEIYSDILNFIQGKKFKVFINNDPSFYWVGRLHVSSYQTEKSRMTIVIDYDFEPYKYDENGDFESETINVSGTAMQTFYGSDMEVSPLFDITSTDYKLNPDEKISRGEATDILYQASTFLGSSKAKTSTTSQYIDVSSSYKFFDAILWNQDRGYISGYTGEIFAPNRRITRGQFLNALYALKGKPSASGSIPFKDVTTKYYCYKAVRWAFANGYVTGTSDKKFSPNEAISRAQAIYIVWLVAGSPSNTSTATFIDLKNGGTTKPWYYDAVTWAAEMGFVSGFSDNTYRPSDKLTRAQFIQILYTYTMDGTVPDSSYNNPFDDVSENAYYYNAVRWAWNKGVDPIINGRTADTFDPNGIILRKQAYAVAYKMYQRDFTSSSGVYVPYDPDTDGSMLEGIELPTDVPETDYYYDAVCWALIYGITELDKAFLFHPDDPCTRAMAPQMLYAAAVYSGLPETERTSTFKDVKKTTKYYINACKWAVQKGILNNAEQAGLTVTIENDQHGERSADVPSGTDSKDPYLVISNGENQVTFTGNGTAVVRYKKGKL